MAVELIKYSIAETAWFLVEEGLKGIVEQFAHPQNKRRQYMVYDYQGQRVFVKSFQEKGFAGRIRRMFAPRGKVEFQIGLRLASLGIPTPKVLGYGTGKNSSVVIEEHVDGQSFLYAIQKSTDKKELLLRLADFIKQLRQKHVRHNDLHLDNILIRGNAFYLIDLHKTKIKSTFSKADELSNVTHALGMIYDDLSDREREFFFERYDCETGIRREIEENIGHLKKNWVIKKKKRAFRNTSILRASDGYIYVKGAESEANGEFVTAIKEGRKATVELYSDHIRKIYRNQRRLRSAWENHVVLTYLGSGAVPRTYYVKVPLLSSDGYIAMEDLGHKGVELDRFLDGKYDGMNKSERKAFIQSFALFLRSLFRHRILHKDLKGCNVFVVNSSRFVLLDIEDIVFEAAGERRLKKMLMQLNTTVPKRISSQDRIRFFLTVTSSLNVDGRRLFEDVARESLKSDIVYEGTKGLVRESW